MDFPDQPPPYAPAPPVTRAAMRSRRRLWAIWIIGGVSFVILLYYVTTPVHLRAATRSPAGDAKNNQRQIHAALMEFDKEYGAFPNASTVPEVIAATATPLASSLGTRTANDYLRQLLAQGLGNERMFYPGFGPKPDNVFTAGRALGKGECGFAYVVGLSTSDNPSLPLLIGPVVPGQKKFDPKPFDGMAVVLRIDGSATFQKIQSDGGFILRYPGTDGTVTDYPFHPDRPDWGGQAITIAWPE